MSAPKQLAKRQKLERKRRRKRESSLKHQGKQQTGGYRSDCFEPLAILNGPVAGLKMSEVLADFIDPLLDSIDGLTAYRHLLFVAKVAWNVALEPEHRRGAMLDDIADEFLSSASPLVRQECRGLLDWLVARKLESFAMYRRPIVALHVEELEDGTYYLTVASGVL